MEQQKAPATKAPALSLRKKLSFAMVASLLMVLALEGLGRIAGFPSGAVRSLSKVGNVEPEVFANSVGMWQPGFKGRIAWPVEIAYDLHINSLGFRGPEITLTKPPGVFRVLCLGDSTTFSVYVNENETWPVLLQQRLSQDHPTIEVINGGSPAWGTHDQLRFLKERASKIKPDLIIHMFCCNDPWDIAGDIEGQKGRYAQKLAEVAQGVSLIDKLRFYTALGEMEMRLQMAWKQARAKNRLITDELAKEQNLEPAMWQNFETVYQGLVEFCQREKITLISACFPDVGRLLAGTPGFEPKLKETATRFAIPFVPLAAAFQESEKAGKATLHMPVDTHANQNGNAIIAREIAQFLAAQRLGPYAR